MPGFYTKHLKSKNAKEFAVTIEAAFSKISSTDGKTTTVEINTSESGAIHDLLSAGYAVLRDHPEYFYYHTNFTATTNGKSAKLTTKLLYSHDEIVRYKAMLAAEINRIRSLIRPSWTKWDKEKFIFEHLQSTVEYVDDGKDERYNLVGALLEHKAVCEGISKAFAVLCHELEIPCIVVFSKTHMWNLVNLNGTLCNVDATYATRGNLGVNYTFFNTSDKYMEEAHQKVLDCIPPCNDDTLGYYARTGTFFKGEKELKVYLLKHLTLSRQTAHVKLMSGNIESTVKSVIGLIPRSFRYSINHCANTAIIKAG